uniref:Uncharacterized protein n=1 Tax=Rhizophora mucronata TaxID=61149 RepID=A0A2P2KWU1_RHIMU
MGDLSLYLPKNKFAVILTLFT